MKFKQKVMLSAIIQTLMLENGF